MRLELHSTGTKCLNCAENFICATSVGPSMGTVCACRLEAQTGNSVAHVVIKGKATARPKIEMSSVVRGRRDHAASASADDHERLDMLAVYAKRNKKLDAELARMQAQLEEARQSLNEMEHVRIFFQTLQSLQPAGTTELYVVGSPMAPYKSLAITNCNN